MTDSTPDPWFVIRKQPDHPAPWVVLQNPPTPEHPWSAPWAVHRFWTWQEAMDWINNK